MNQLDGTLRNFTAPYNGFAANMAAISAAGFNCVRIDFNNRSLHAGNVAAFLQQMDQAVVAAKGAYLKVIFVDHDNEGLTDLLTGHDCASQQHNGIWYDVGGASDGTDGCGHLGHTTQASFRSDWTMIARRYARIDAVVGYELWNEPFTYGRSTWGDGTAHDIRKMAEEVGSAMLTHDQGKLIFAPCPQNHGPTLLFDKQTISYAPWGDCTGARYQPVVFTVNGRKITNQVVYDIHLYPSSISGIANIFGSSAAPGIIAAMNASFGFLMKDGIAPVWNGEGGTGFYQPVDDLAWAKMIVQYFNGELGLQGAPTYTGNQQGMGFSWMYWGTSYGPTSDNLGILNDDGSLRPGQLSILAHIFFYPKPFTTSCAPSANGSYMQRGARALVDAACNSWGISTDGHVTKNGVAQVRSFGAVTLVYTNGGVWFMNSASSWYPVQ